jgi:hypothetical protein
MLGRWLDPPAVAERKRLQRALHGAGQSGADRQLEFGCFVPIALAWQSWWARACWSASGCSRRPRQLTVRVIDDSARGGPAVLSTAIVPLR